jgi:cytochrome P450
MTATEPLTTQSATGRAGAARPLSYPGPPRRAAPRLLAKLRGDRLGLLADAAAEYGDVIRFRIGPKTLYYFNHPEHAKHVLSDNSGNYHKGIGLAQARRFLGDGLLTSEDKLWHGQRQIIHKAFKRNQLAAFADVIADEADAMVARMDSHVAGPPVDMAEEVARLTLAVLGQALLSSDLTPFAALAGAFDVAQDQAMFDMVTLDLVPPWIPTPRNRRFERAQRQLEDVASALIAERERDYLPGAGDMISLLLDAYRDEPDSRLRHRRLRDELVTILLAGHETTASTLSWTWYLLDRHPEVARRMHAEATEVLGDRKPGHDDLSRLTYTTMVIQEAMRLYPPVWGLPRQATSADDIGGYRVPAGADVMICPYTLHRHPAFWPEPDRFDPERFSAEAAGPAHRYAYIPFGAGPRVCVGSHLGMMEATLVAAMVARRFRLELIPGRAVAPEANLSLRVQGGLPMVVRPA